jgi:nicotinamide-nucleotide amidase
MRALATRFLAPWVRAHSELKVEYALVRTVGIAESVLEERLSSLSAELGGAWVAYLPGMGGVDVRITLPEGLSPDERQALADRARAFVVERAGDYVYACDDRTLEEVVGGLLAERGAKVALAESCTGGLLGGRITQTPGSSAYFEGGVVCYSNAAKVALCGVLPATLDAHGAVSEETARELAAGIRARFGVAYGVGVTGIAGPDGGTPEKPVGTVHVAASGPEGAHHRLLRVFGNRAQVRERSVTAALDLLRRLMLGLPATTAGAMFTPPRA